MIDGMTNGFAHPTSLEHSRPIDTKLPRAGPEFSQIRIIWTASPEELLLFGSEELTCLSGALDALAGARGTSGVIGVISFLCVCLVALPEALSSLLGRSIHQSFLESFARPTLERQDATSTSPCSSDGRLQDPALLDRTLAKRPL